LKYSSQAIFKQHLKPGGRGEFEAPPAGLFFLADIFMDKPLRLLHTSDWHLGRALCGRRRLAEFAAFLDWLVETIDREKVDVLAVAGDVFDSSAPSAQIQSLYYRFLGRVALETDCGQAVIIAGNHDSPALLAAPGAILRALDIHVVGWVEPDLRNEIFLLKDPSGGPRLIVAAVPYPRDRDLRESEAGESAGDKERKLIEAIERHYREAGRLAGELRDSLKVGAPLLAMGHLFAAGGLTVEGDGVRSLYVGALGQVPASIFPDSFNYVALGHLHQPQVVGGNPSRRYSGAPLAHSFSEAGRPKSVTLVDFLPGGSSISQVPVPVFQRLESLKGDWDQLSTALDRLREEEAEAWLEIEYEGIEIIGDLRERVREKTSGTALEVLRVRDTRLTDRALAENQDGETLKELDEMEVFRRCLKAHQVPAEQQPELEAAYGEILTTLKEERPAGDEILTGSPAGETDG